VIFITIHIALIITLSDFFHNRSIYLFFLLRIPTLRHIVKIIDCLFRKIQVLKKRHASFLVWVWVLVIVRFMINGGAVKFVQQLDHASAQVIEAGKVFGEWFEK